MDSLYCFVVKIVPKSSHDRSCSKESSQNAGSTTSISVSVKCATSSESDFSLSWLRSFAQYTAGFDSNRILWQLTTLEALPRGTPHGFFYCGGNLDPFMTFPGSKDGVLTCTGKPNTLRRSIWAWSSKHLTHHSICIFCNPCIRFGKLSEIPEKG